ncbi:MAG: PDDEXK nuclease domain-containing protein [Nanoarchaeota archaeon]|nr:PDDEXK nuclease domain-containing protein [Nanoarchaeota archaeon]
MKKQIKKEIIEKEKYNSLISSIGTLLENARKTVYSQINQILVKTYWEIGKRIIEYEQKGKARADYGSKLLDNLSKDLTKLHGKGFSRDNLEKMRKFYTTFPNSETLSRKLSWSHYCLVMRLDNPLARKFYIKEIENENWSVRELDRQINSMVFERIALSKDKKSVLQLAQKGHVIEKAKDLVKDPYVLEFLGLEKLDRYSETQLEEKIITNLQKFLLELGKGFMFVARQQKITLEDEHFYIDLVFYNRLLKCFMLIELKIGKSTHKDLGQLQMYVNYYDREIKQKEENPSIGILLCADKKEAIVKYTFPENNKQLFASKYKLYLPSKEELEEEVEKLV